MTIVGRSLKSTVKGVEVDIHKDKFGRMFHLPFQGVTYTYERPIKFNKFKHFIFIFSFIVNAIEDMKLLIKANFLKPKVCFIHYLIIRIFFQRTTTSKMSSGMTSSLFGFYPSIFKLIRLKAYFFT